MNLHTLKSLAISTCLALGLFMANSAHAAVPTVEYIGKAAITNCPTALNSSLVFHSDKIIFMIGEGVLQPLATTDFAALEALPRLVELDIKVRDNPNNVADLKGKVLTFLGAAPSKENRELIKITDVEYTAVVCPKRQ